jgi:hypothetical protein
MKRYSIASWKMFIFAMCVHIFAAVVHNPIIDSKKKEFSSWHLQKKRQLFIKSHLLHTYTPGTKK